MRNVKKIIRVIWMPILLIVLALLFLWLSKSYYEVENPRAFQVALAKWFSGLSSTIFIGSVLKFFLDFYQEAKEKKEASKEFRVGLLNDLRSIVDEVELAKILIRSHKSAKTYGVCVREKIMPACIRLWEVKRSLVDKEDPFLEGAITDIRAHIHAMIAYLKALMLEFEENYIAISTIQKYQEAAYREQVKSTLLTFDKMDLEELKTLKNYDQSWQIIQDLPFCRDYLNQEDVENSKYFDFFFTSYRECRDLLKNGKTKGNKEVTVNERYDVLRRKSGGNRRTYKKINTSEYHEDLVLWILYEELGYEKKKDNNNL